MRFRWSLAVVPLVAMLLASGPAPAAPRLTPPRAYYRPTVADGMTFPVARSNWLSLVQFRNDWHDPRFRLIDGRWQLVGFHEGVDITAEKGTPVLSASTGIVEAVGWTFYSGTRVGVRGTDGRYYFYAHLSRVMPGIAVGSPVDVGDVLGLVGNTGYGPPGREDEFPPHLHFGIQAGSEWITPYPMVRSLYRSSVEATTEAERDLARLARQGRGEAFERLASKLYLDVPTE